LEGGSWRAQQDGQHVRGVQLGEKMAAEPGAEYGASGVLVGGLKGDDHVAGGVVAGEGMLLGV